MSDAPSLAVVYPHHLTWLDKTLVWGAFIVSGYLFLTVGWHAMRPDDPLGAVSLLSRETALLMILQAGLLAAVAAALGTVLAGRRLVEVGTCAAAAGLALTSLRGGTMETLLLLHASDGSHRGFAVLLAIEAVAWFAVVVIVLFVSGLVMRWCFEGRRHHVLASKPEEVQDPRILAAYDMSALLPERFVGLTEARTPLADGVRHLVITVAVAVAAFNIVSTGWASHAIRHGQACFVVAASVCAGCYFAHRMAPVKSALWSILAVGLFAVGGYVWAALRPGEGGGPATVPHSNFLRILPIQFVSVGTVSAIAMLWYMHLPEEEMPPKAKLANKPEGAR